MLSIRKIHNRFVCHNNSDVRENIVRLRFISSIEFNLPLDWNIVAITVCPTGDLLYSSIIKTSYGLEVNTSCVFSSSQMPSILFSIVKPLNHILEENQRQLSSSDKKDKTEWWNERQALDHEIEILLDHLESR